MCFLELLFLLGRFVGDLSGVSAILLVCCSSVRNDSICNNFVAQVLVVAPGSAESRVLRACFSILKWQACQCMWCVIAFLRD